MPDLHHLTRRSTAMLATVLIALATLPAMASARPAANGPGPRSAVSAAPSEIIPAPTVVNNDSRDLLPIALAGAALAIAIGATGYMLVSVAPIRHELGGGH